MTPLPYPEAFARVRLDVLCLEGAASQLLRRSEARAAPLVSAHAAEFFAHVLRAREAADRMREQLEKESMSCT